MSKTLETMVERSLTLQRLLREASYVKESGAISTNGFALVRHLAHEHHLRDWPETRNVQDYDALIEVLSEHLAAAKTTFRVQP